MSLLEMIQQFFHPANQPVSSQPTQTGWKDAPQGGYLPVFNEAAPQYKNLPVRKVPLADPFNGYANKIQIPNEYRSLIEQSAKQNGIHPSVLASILAQESGFNPKRIGDTDPNDRGIAQINRVSHPDITDEQAFDPNFAIPWAAKYTRQNIDNFNGDINKGVAAYNVGPGGAAIQGPELFGGGPEGQTYINNVSNNLNPDFAKRIGFKVGPVMSKPVQ